MEVVAGGTVSQVVLSDAVSGTEPEAVLEKIIVWFGMLVAPCTA